MTAYKYFQKFIMGTVTIGEMAKKEMNKEDNDKTLKASMYMLTYQSCSLMSVCFNIL